MSEQESPKTARKSPARAESPSSELVARRKQMLTVYVGPDRPFGLPLRTSAVLRGEPFPQLAAVIEANPDLKKLFVPVEELAETRRQIRRPGGVMQRLFNDINEASRKARKAKE
ncbi:50S ribosomal protein L37 [uncultured Bilophila sp.]|uniref:50S ribosomal protein L37 n=1 Tax=uncultured Bilophila sp. TaxID=529385 RepID=UPI00280C14A7|nr:50S ribosomal protein L37 [uncultured Bilophila sp.]